jgi:hypothetical protein
MIIGQLSIAIPTNHSSVFRPVVAGSGLPLCIWWLAVMVLCSYAMYIVPADCQLYQTDGRLMEISLTPRSYTTKLSRARGVEADFASHCTSWEDQAW